MSDDGTVYVADGENHRVRAISEGRVSTFAGSGEAAILDGQAASAAFGELRDIALGPDGALYVLDTNRVRVIRDGHVSTVAGR